MWFAPLANLFELFELWYIESIRNDWFFRLIKKDKYYDFSVDLYTHGIINDKKIKDIKNNYDYSREKDSKHKNDDFEL